MQEAEKPGKKVKQNRHMNCINICISKGIILNQALLPISGIRAWLPAITPGCIACLPFCLLYQTLVVTLARPLPVCPLLFPPAVHSLCALFYNGYNLMYEIFYIFCNCCIIYPLSSLHNLTIQTVELLSNPKMVELLANPKTV